MMNTKIFAHRGASGYAPENTMEAFMLADAQRADGIELDIQLTRDGEIVVIHDEVIDRVSNGHGPVYSHTLKELKALSFSNHMALYPNAKIPTLREVLEYIRTTSMEVNIELKTGIIPYIGIEEKTVELVKELGLEKRIIYSSFNHYTISRIRELDPEAETAYLFSDVIIDVDLYALSHGVRGLHPCLSHMKMGDFLQKYQKNGCRVRVWTVNDPKDMTRLLEQGVDAIITNYPDKAVNRRAAIMNR